MLHILNLVIPLLLSASVRATPCVAFDSNWNLYAFGFNGKDWNAGTQDTWVSGQPKEITASGRPPFDGTGTTCYLNQFQNALYVLNGDAANPSALHMFDATTSTWSTQAVQTGTFDPLSFTGILDHDTNIFYALSKSSLYALSVGDLAAAKPEPLAWTEQQTVPFATDAYKPVMAIASNHIHFLGIPDEKPGYAKIFVIHFSYLQPESQSYGQPAFPVTHGQVTSLFKTEGPQMQFAFVPDDNSGTFIVDVGTNTTRAMPAPTKKDTSAVYFASLDSIVQLTKKGEISYLSTAEGATWQPISGLSSITTAAVTQQAAAPPSSPSANPSNGNAPSGSAKPSGTGSKTPVPSSRGGTISSSSDPETENGASSLLAKTNMGWFLLSGVLAMGLSFVL